MVIWDRELVGGFKENHKPSQNVKVSKKDIKSEDPVEHIINYLQKDNLGKLCNMHMALCDKLGAQGPQNPEMIELSSLIQESVDFSKHGKAVDPAQWEKFERKLEGKYPDYLDKDDAHSYDSSLILGQLYREVELRPLYI